MTSSGQLGKSPRRVSSEYPSVLSLEAGGSVRDPSPGAVLLCLAPSQQQRAAAPGLPRCSPSFQLLLALKYRPTKALGVLRGMIWSRTGPWGQEAVSALAAFTEAKLAAARSRAEQSPARSEPCRALGSASWLRPAPVSCSSRCDFFPLLSFQLLDLKIFVDTDSDIRLVRRLRRDISERGRDIEGVIKQYNKFVKPAFDQYIQPTMRLADIVVPRGTAWGPSGTPSSATGGRGRESGESKVFLQARDPKTRQKQVPGESVPLFPQLVLPYKRR